MWSLAMRPSSLSQPQALACPPSDLALMSATLTAIQSHLSPIRRYAGLSGSPAQWPKSHPQENRSDLPSKQRYSKAVHENLIPNPPVLSVRVRFASGHSLIFHRHRDAQSLLWGHHGDPSARTSSHMMASEWPFEMEQSFSPLQA
jgi:hypothetical protein